MSAVDGVYHTNDSDTMGRGGDYEKIDKEVDAAKKIPVNRATYTFVLCAAVNSCNLGYDVGVNTNAGPKLQEDFGLSDVQLELFLGSINFWSMFGALMAHSVTDRYGRRWTFLCAALGFLVGVTIMSTAQSFEILMFGRFFVGMGVGVGLAIDPLYIAEVSPPSHRGELVAWSEIALNVGIVGGFATGLAFVDVPAGLEWRVMLALGGVLPLIMIVLVSLVMPESPRWLVAKKQEGAARDVLERIYPAGYDIDGVVDEIREALELEEAAEHAVGWNAILHPTPAMRRILLLGVGTSVIQQAVGIDAIQYYLKFVLEGSGLKSETSQLWVLILLGLVKLAFVFVGGHFFDSHGRRPLFFMSLLGCAASLVLVSFTFMSNSPQSHIVTVAGLALYLAFFSSAMGPGGWLVPSEIYANCIRAKAMSLTTFLNRVTATLMASTFLSTAGLLSWAGFFILLACICIIGCVFLYIYLPETKGHSIEDMTRIFAEITGDRFILDLEEELIKRKKADVELSTKYGSTDEATAASGGSPSLS